MAHVGAGGTSQTDRVTCGQRDPIVTVRAPVDGALSSVASRGIAGVIWSMTLLRLHSAEHPFDDVRVAGQAARLLALVEATGAWQLSGIVEQLDLPLFQDALSSLGAVGVAASAALEAEGYAQKPSEDFARWISHLRDVVVSSPIPDTELPKLDALFKTEPLAGLLGIGASSLRRYLADERRVPDDVANRVHLVTRIVGDLAGFYNERGIRHWFTRPRAQLHGRTPADVLHEAWDSEEDAADRVVDLAAELVG